MQHCNCRWESATLFSLIFGGVCYFGRFVLRSLPVLESFYPTKIEVFLWMTLLLALILMTRCKLFIWLLLFSLIGASSVKNTLKILELSFSCSSFVETFSDLWKIIKTTFCSSLWF